MLLSGKNSAAFLLTLSFLLTAFFTQAQSKETAVPQASYFKFSLGYLTNDVYDGRKDSFSLPYITPVIGYYNKSGFYLEGSLSYLASSGNSQVDAGSLTAGYNFHSTDEKLTGELYASKYFTNQSSYSVHGEIKAAAGAYLDYNTKVVSVTGGTDVSFSGKPDIGTTLGLSHLFQLDTDSKWTLDPSALMNAGTQNFYAGYFTNRKYSLKRKRRLANAGTVKVVVIKNGFSVLDYEFSLPLAYDDKKWGLFFTPTYALPISPIKYSLNNGVTYQTEKLSNSFYAEFGAYIKF